MIGATSGTFALVLQNSAVTPPIDLSASINDIIAAIEKALLNLISVQCNQFSGSISHNTSSLTTLISLTFISNNPANNALIQVLDLSLNGTHKSIAVTRTYSHSILPGGTFNMYVNGVMVPSIPIGVSAFSLRLLINSESEVNDVLVEGPFGVSRTGYSWIIRFNRPIGDLPMIELDTSNVIGYGFQAQVFSLLNGSRGSLFFDSIPVWMTEIPLVWATDGGTSSAVEVFQDVTGGNVMKAVCDGSGVTQSGFQGLAKGNESTCGFTYLVRSTPIVSSFKMNTTFKDQLPVYNISLLGSGFLLGGSVSAIYVSVAGSSCNVTEASDSLISCIAYSVVVGSYYPQVYISGVGLAAVLPNSDALSFSVGVLNITPSSGSLAGGEVVQVRGFGFNITATSLTFNDSLECTIIKIDPGEIVCVTPSLPYSTSVNTTVKVFVDGLETSQYFTYSADLTPIVGSVIPSFVSSAVDSMISISGNGFTLGTSVKVGDEICAVLNVSAQFLSCYLLRNTTSLAGAAFELAVYVPGKGFAGRASSIHELPTITRGYEVRSITPTGGSIFGGTRLTISGVGFVNSTSVSFSDSISDSAYAKLILALGIAYTNITSHVQYCDIVSLSFFSIECIIRELPLPLEYSDNVLVASVQTNGILPFVSEISTLNFVQSLNFTPRVTSASEVVIDARGVATFNVSGSSLYSTLGNTSVIVGGSSCLVDPTISTSNTIVVSCSNLTAGLRTFSAMVSNLGYSEIENNVGLNISLIVVSGEVDESFNSTGSILGGPKYTISGLGFSSICSENNVTFVLVDGSVLDGSSLLRTCGYSEIQGFLPPVLDQNQLSAKNIDVRKVTLAVDGVQTELNLFAYTYSTSNTPFLIAETSSATTLNVTVSMLNHPHAYSSLTEIMIGYSTVSCVSKNSSGTSAIMVQLNCTIPPLVVGNYTLFVNNPPFGFASSSLTKLRLPSVAVNFAVDDYQCTFNSSAEGRLKVNVTGSGFPNDLIAVAEGTSVNITVESPILLSFETPAYHTTAYVDSLRSLGIIKDLTQNINASVPSIATGFSSNMDLTQSAFDLNYATYFYSTSANCYIGVEATGSNRIQPSRMRFYPLFHSARSIQSALFECSADGGLTYTTLASVSSANEGWNYVDCNSTLWCTHIRYRALDNSNCRLAEVKFLGVVAHSSNTLLVSIVDPQSGYLLPACNISYADPFNTPALFSISPENGTSLGGTVVSLKGNFLQSSVSRKPSVKLNGISCSVTSWNATEIQCITGYRGPDNIQSGSVWVSIPGVGIATSGDNVLFIYMDRWSERTTWKNGQLPVDNDFVWIPNGQSIMLDQDTPNLLFLLVQGALYLDDSLPHISIDAKYIFVYGGKFIVYFLQVFRSIANFCCRSGLRTSRTRAT